MNRIVKLSVITSIIFILFGFITSVPEEGMFPLSEIHKLDLNDAGLKISVDELYNPNGVSLVDALVKIGGCTGSFVSDKGLMITNHHCAFGAVNRASTPEHNYLRDGFWAEDFSKEIPAPGYIVRITESYEDVSDQILSLTKGIDDPVERNKIIADKISELEEAATDEENSISAKVSEMFIGKTYVLFKYRMIKDVRLVFAPPRAIGEFGGESDNWIWPRHTGDFSFMRAYVAPDGSAAEYSEENVPFTPKNYLKVNPEGVKENDFVFILGYPGRTYRHRPSQYLEFQKEIQLPYISQLYAWVIDLLEDESAKSTELQLKYASKIKSYANVMKNYRGKLKGLNKIDIIGNKRTQEEAMKKLLENDPELSNKYLDLFPTLDEEYTKMKNIGESYLWFAVKNRVSGALSLMESLVKYIDSKDMDENDKPSYLKEERLDDFKKGITKRLKSLDSNLEVKKLKKMFKDASNFSEDSKILALNNFDSLDKLNDFADKIINSDFFSEEKFNEMMEMSKSDFYSSDDPIISFAIELNENNTKVNDEIDNINGVLTKYLADFVDLKQAFSKSMFVPDANSTLRLTYGYIEGYKPADAVYYSPISTLSGVIEKSYMGGDYVIPDKLRTVYNKDIEGNKDRPVAILYSTDTTGGNSGSPIMDANGKLIGVNFDRAYEATINDFAWDKSYSRSIGVDIRYVLWITKNIGGANNLLEEMGVSI